MVRLVNRPCDNFLFFSNNTPVRALNLSPVKARPPQLSSCSGAAVTWFPLAAHSGNSRHISPPVWDYGIPRNSHYISSPDVHVALL